MPAIVLAAAVLLALPAAAGAAGSSADRAPAAATDSATSSERRTKAPRSRRAAALTCTRTVVLRSGTARSLRRYGFRPRAGGRWVRRLPGRRLEVLCARRTAIPRWTQRGLGAKVTGSRSVRSTRGSKLAAVSSAVSFPATLRGRVSIDLPGKLGRTGWQMQGVPAAPLVDYRSGAMYSTDQYDVVYETGFGNVKESIVVHKKQGTRTWSWKLHWTRGTDPTIDSAGRIVYGGKVIIARPVVYNARKRVVMRPRWRLDGRVASFTVRDARLPLPYVVDPTADFPQRIHPDKLTGTRISDAENVRDPAAPPLGAASSCTKLPFDVNGQSLFGSMIARRVSPGAAIATATPSGGPNGWALQDGTAAGGQPINAIDALSDTELVAVGAGGLALRSTDGGCAWTRLTTGTTRDLNGVVVPVSGTIWIAGDNGTILRSTNGGASFSSQASGVTNDLTAIDAVDATTGWASGVGRRVLRTTNSGGSWTDMGQSNMGDVWDVSVVSPTTAFIVGDPGKVFKTTNGGTSWNFQVNAGTNLYGVAAFDTNNAVAVGDTGIVYRTVDGGANWTNPLSGVIANLRGVDVTSTGTYFAVGDTGTIVRSFDQGLTWNTMANAAGGVGLLAIAARSNTVAWTAGSNGAIQRLYADGAAGSYGWVSEANGGTSLAAGPWTIGARLCREPYSTGSTTVGFRARIWKVTVSGGALTGSTPMTPWSATSATGGLAGGACANRTVAVTPTVTTMNPTEHFYIEYALVVAGGAMTNQTIALNVADTNTYVDFGAPAVNNTPVPPNLRVTSAIGSNGWTNDTTPTLQANLADPDWYHHIRFQVCADAACASVVAEGTSPANQLLGSTNGSWTVSTPLGDGFYYMRARTEEDGGDAAVSAWTSIDPIVTNSRCTAPGVGPCDKFGVDTGPPTAPGTVNDGVGADIDVTGNSSVLSANWGAATDGAGAVTYETCISTATPCAGTIAGSWASNGGATTMSRTGLTLVNATTYYVCVRAIDNAGNAGPVTCSDGVLVDTAAPPATAEVRDGAAADLDLTSTATQLVANWDAVADIAPGSGMLQYNYCFSTSSTGADCAAAATVPWAPNGLATSVTRTGLSLTHATTYYACIRPIDNVGNVGATRCSDGIVVDVMGPTWPGGSLSDDGPGPGDVDWTTSTTTLASNWTAATDPSGILRYEYCLSTATSCAGTVVVNWTSNALAMSQSSTGLSLTHGQVYFSCVRGVDNAGNVGAVLCSDGQTVDSVPPVLPPAVNDGTAADIDWLLSLSTASGNWPGGSDALSGLQDWEYCISTGAGCTGTVVRTWTSTGTTTTATAAGLALVEGEQYLVCVRGTDVAGNVTPGFACSDGQRVDTQAPPATGAVNDGTAADISYQVSDTQLSANWSAVADPVPGVGNESGLERYQYCISTSSTGADCAGGATVTWTDASPLTSTSMTHTGLSLVNMTTYYTCVRSNDVATNQSTTACSNGVIIDIGPPAASWTSWTENSPNMYTPGGNLLWYNPSAPASGSGTATATVYAFDPGAGMNRVEFPSLGAAGWGPGGNDTTAGAGDSWTWDYAFTGGGAIGDPALANATAYDNGGAFTGSPNLDFDIRPDSVGPVVGTMPAMGGGLQNTTTFNQSIPVGTDADSGIARWVMDYRFAPLYDGSCGAWDPWNDGSLTAGYFGTTSNGATLNFNHFLNDPDLNGVPDMFDAFCFQTRVRVFDNVDNSSLIAENGFVRFDFGAPDVAITGPADGSSQGGDVIFTGTTDDVWPGGGFEYVDTGSGIDRVEATYQHQTLPAVNGPACTDAAPTGPWTAHGWTCTWDSTGPGQDGWYDITVTAYDRAGNASSSVTYSYLVDNFAPIAAWHSWNDGFSPIMHAVGNVAWVNPTASIGTYTLSARLTASDAGSGMDRVDFPALGTGWSPGATTAGTFTSPTPAPDAYTLDYTFTNPALLAAPGVRQAIAYDNAGNPTPVDFEVRLDSSPPTNVTASVVTGLQNTANVAVTLSSGADGALESGIGSWTLRYDRAPWVNGGCGAYTGTWTVAASGAGVAPPSYSHDVSGIGSGCYRYLLQVSDNVGNVGQSPAPTTQRMVDLDDPTVLITSPADGTLTGGTFNVQGDAVDAESGIDHVRLEWSGPSSGVICDPATLAGAAPNWTFDCSWATGPADLALADGTYTVTATSYDVAGNVSATHSISVTLDNNPPFVGFHSFDTTGNPYAFWAGPVGTNNELWYNPDAPAGSYSFDVLMTASDPAGVDRVEFDGAGSGWTPGGAAATQTVPVGPADRYAQTYTFDTSGAVADPPTLEAWAFDPADNGDFVPFELTPDLVDPAPVTLSYPNSYFGSTALTVTINTGTDADSGVRGWELLRSDGTLSGGTCSGWSPYSTSVATGTGAFSGTQADTVSDPGCFRYQLVVTDNVGRIGTLTGTDETMIDLTPPTGSLVVSEGTNPQYQYLASPTQIYVNTSAVGSGTFNVDVTATAASGILDVDFPVLAAGFGGDGVVPGPGPNFPHVYSWTGPAGTPAVPENVHVRSNSLGPLDLPFEVIADPNAPTASAPTHANGFTTNTSVSVSFTAGSDTGSGVAGHQLERETGTLAAGACTWNNDWTAVAGATTPGTTADTIAHATCYRYRTAVTDNVGNVGYSPLSIPIMVDTTPPAGASIVLAEATNPSRQYVAAADTIWVAADPGGPASFTATVTANDPESGTGAAIFPALGSTFAFTAGGPFDGSYAWSATAATPGATPVVTVGNGAGLTTTIPFNVYVDGATPTGGSIDQEVGFVTDFMVDLSYGVGSDADSGLGTWRIERRSAPYTIATDTCGAYGPWTPYPNPSGDPGGSPHVDSSVVQPNCYEYRLVMIDNVGNRIDLWDGDTTKVIYDITPPTPFDLNLPTNPALPAITTGVAATGCETIPAFTSATPNFTWTAATDAESGMSHYDVYLDGVGAVTATVPEPGTSWTAPALADGAHTIGVRALDYQANFRNAGPAFPTDIRIDTAPPTGSLAAPAMGSWTGDTTPTLDWNAADASCLARIEVDVDGSTVAVASGSEGSWTPAAPLANGAHTWSFTAWDSAGNSTTFGPYSFGIDIAPPAPFAITAPTGGSTVRGFVDVSWSASSDAESGLPATGAYQVLVDGTVRATVGSGTTSTTVTGITNGLHTLVVRAFDAVGNYTDTPAVLFTGYPAIPAPVLVSPANASYHNSVPTLTWNWPSDGGPPPTDFDVYLDGALDGNETYPTMTHAIADPGDGTHSWSVEQHDPYTGTVTSATWNFTIDRTAPLNPGPLTRAATIVSWPLPTDPAAPVASGIDHQEFWIDDGTTSSFAMMGATMTSRNYGALPDGTYTMWIRAYDRAGNYTDSPPLVVVNDSVPPTPFNLTPPPALPALPAITHGSATTPSCETSPTYVSATPTLQWSASSDATSGLAGYDVYIDNVLVATEPPGTTSHVPATPLTGGPHTWRVVARDNFGLSRSSTPSPMNVLVDGASPTISYGTPADGSFTADTTPSFNWSASDDACLARIELTVGANVYVLTGTAGGYTPTAVLPEGPTTWSLRAFDAAGNVVSAGPPRTINVDTTPPSGVTATFPANGSTVPEGMLTFAWSAGTDGTGSGVARYDLIIDGTPVASNLTTTSDGTHQILGPPNSGDPAVPHTWQIRIYDNVGNSALFPFSFAASWVPDTTPPDPFNLLTPTNGASVPAGTPLTWEPSWDFKGVTQYRVYIDGNLAATTTGTTTSFTPAAGAGAPICTIDYDPATTAGCITGGTYSWGTGATTAGTGAVSPDMNVATYAGWSATGAALGVGDPTVTPITQTSAGFDGNRRWTAVEYAATVPATGADLRFEHRYRTHTLGQTAYDGATVELMVDDEGNGFGDDAWGATCEFDARAIYGTTLDCMYPIVDLDGGYTAVMGGANKSAHPLAGQHSFAGDSAGTVQTRMTLAEFAGMNIRIRFRIGTDSCWTGMPTNTNDYQMCALFGVTSANMHPVQWRIDNVELANPSLLPGVHSWYVVARDAAGNQRQSNQTWTFDLQP